VTSGPAAEESPIWSPDGAHIVYASNQNGVYDLYRIAASGSGREEAVYRSGHDKRPSDWSPDGRFIAFTDYDPTTRADILALDMNAAREAQPVVKTAAAEDQPRFSPDGKWIAYRSNRTGRHEIYVQPFPSGDPLIVSLDGGIEPFWRTDSQELFFVSADNWLTAVGVKGAGTFQAGVPTRLFELPERSCASCIAAAIHDGRFLVITGGYAPEAPIRVLTSWTSAVRTTAGSAR
jgi:Tol biopolymer transport system component